MKISELKDILKEINVIRFKLPDGSFIPKHFHVTEVGKVSKHYIDCGGTERKEEKISFQLWTAEDYDHRLAASKLNKIVEIAEDRLQLPDAEIEVEYQSDTIGKYVLKFNNGIFILESLQTDCLAKDSCGIPVKKEKLQLSEVGTCKPGSGCC